MGSLSIWHWLVVLAVVLLVFGTRKLRNLGSDLGGAVKGFKQAMHEDQASLLSEDKGVDSRVEESARENVKSQSYV